MSETTRLLLRVRSLARRGIEELEAIAERLAKADQMTVFERDLLRAQSLGKALGYLDSIDSELADVTEPGLRLVPDPIHVDVRDPTQTERMMTELGVFRPQD